LLCRQGKSSAINPAIEFNPDLAASAACTIAFVKVNECLNFANVHRRFEFDEFILLARRGTMVLVIVSFR
jgi:hypothetical protein